MRYGYFDDQKREYVINRPDTPLPWINYLGCENYFGLISNTAGGYSFYKDARLRRLTRFRYNNAPLDCNGRYLYLRDDDAKTPTYWSPSWQPTRTALDDYECRHGLGYTIIRSLKANIEAQIRYFIPLGENLEIWECTLIDRRDKAANLSVFSALEFALWDALDDAANFQRNYNVGEVEVVDNVIYHKTEYRERRNHFAFFTCSESSVGFDTKRDAFLGRYHGWNDPEAVLNGSLSNTIAIGWQPVGVQHFKLQLKPGEKRTLIFLLGYQENPVERKFDPPTSQTINKTQVLPIIRKYLDPQVVQKAFEELAQYWDGLLRKYQVDTPDEHTNRMVNIWNVYQDMVTFNFSRSASYFESGIGRGMGFRDSNQDLLGFMHLNPERARQRILDLAATQLPTGGAYHQYQPLTKKGNNDVGSGFNDDPLWLILSVSAYLKETGNWDILEERVPYDNQEGSEVNLLEHLRQSIRHTRERLGPHHLPLIGRADWNDCLNLNCFSEVPGQSFQTTTNIDGKVAESVFIAGLFILTIQELIAICDRLGLKDEAGDYKRMAREMERVVWASGWDGDWFRRAYDALGRVLGSRENDEGQIFIEPQGICVMAGLGLEDGRAQKALDSVKERLATEHGIVLHQPAFTHYYLHLGEISTYPPGLKENGSIFCHTNPWIMIAESRLGRGDQAFDYYRRINPSFREEISDVHRCEPYAYVQTIAGRDAASCGEAKNSWLTGSASWNYVAVTQWILGIRPVFDGLMIAPIIPEAWNGFDMTRIFRGNTYRIHVERRGHGNEVELVVDGKPIPGNIIPASESHGTEVRVTVMLGKG